MKPERMPTQILGRLLNFSLPVRQEGKAENLQKTNCGKRIGAFAGMFMLVCSCTMAVMLMGRIDMNKGECTRRYSMENFSPSTCSTNLNPAINADRIQILNAKCKNMSSFCYVDIFYIFTFLTY